MKYSTFSARTIVLQKKMKNKDERNCVKPSINTCQAKAYRASFCRYTFHSQLIKDQRSPFKRENMENLENEEEPFLNERERSNERTN